MDTGPAGIIAPPLLELRGAGGTAAVREEPLLPPLVARPATSSSRLPGNNLGQVAASTLPVAGTPARRWKPSTADLVRLPKSPSAPSVQGHSDPVPRWRHSAPEKPPDP